MALADREDHHQHPGMRVRRLAIVALAAALGGCASMTNPSPTPSWPPVRVSNQAAFPVSVVVNGTTVALIPAGGTADPLSAPLPSRPWAIDIQTPHGQGVVHLDVPAGDITVGLYGSATNLVCGGEILLAVAGPLPAGGPPLPTAVPGASPCY